MIEQEAEEKVLLVVWHSRTGATAKMVETASCAAMEVNGIRVVTLTANEATSDHVMAADALLFAAPENLGSLSGAMKEFFDRTYYDLLDRCSGKPYASIICAGSDGEGAQRQLDRIATGLRLRRVTPSIIINTSAQTREEILASKQLDEKDLKHARELGALLASGLSMGIF